MRHTQLFLEWGAGEKLADPIRSAESLPDEFLAKQEASLTALVVTAVNSVGAAVPGATASPVREVRSQQVLWTAVTYNWIWTVTNLLTINRQMKARGMAPSFSGELNWARTINPYNIFPSAMVGATKFMTDIDRNLIVYRNPIETGRNIVRREERMRSNGWLRRLAAAIATESAPPDAAKSKRILTWSAPVARPEWMGEEPPAALTERQAALALAMLPRVPSLTQKMYVTDHWQTIDDVLRLPPMTEFDGVFRTPIP